MNEAPHGPGDPLWAAKASISRADERGSVADISAFASLATAQATLVIAEELHAIRVLLEHRIRMNPGQPNAQAAAGGGL